MEATEWINPGPSSSNINEQVDTSKTRRDERTQTAFQLEREDLPLDGDTPRERRLLVQ